MKEQSVGDILKKEFMEPRGLSIYRLAKEINVPISRIQDILHDRRKISAITSIKLGRFFSVEEDYFLRLQNNVDIREARELLDDIENAAKTETSAFIDKAPWE